MKKKFTITLMLDTDEGDVDRVITQIEHYVQAIRGVQIMRPRSANENKDENVA